MRTINYGLDRGQAGDLYLPAKHGIPLVCLFHGGFWRMPYGRDQLDPMARSLCDAGFAVWNLGYRRVGSGGHPWPVTLRDVEAALHFLPSLQRAYPKIDLQRLWLVGHSAGGHLAFWAACKALESRMYPIPAGVIGLAPILDLMSAYLSKLGGAAVESFLGGTPAMVPGRYHDASPTAHLPLGIRQYVLHGALDTVVPPAMSEAYVARARAAGDEVEYLFIEDADHMALIQPDSTAFHLLDRCLRSPA